MRKITIDVDTSLLSKYFSLEAEIEEDMNEDEIEKFCQETVIEEVMSSISWDYCEEED